MTHPNGTRHIGARALAWAALATSVAAARGAHADYVGLTGGLSRTPATADFPGSGSTSLGLNGAYDLNERWGFTGNFGVTRPHAAPSAETIFAAKVKDSSAFALGVGASWIPGFGWNAAEHWSIDFGLGFSPRSVSQSGTTIAFESTGPAGKTTAYDAEALLKSASSSADLGLGVNYDTNGDSNFETSLSIGLWPNRVVSTQSIEEIQTKDGKTQTAEQVQQQCANTAKKPQLAKTCKRLMPLLKAQDAAIVTMPVMVSLSETIYSDTTVSVGGTWYLYNKDPNEVGYFTFAQQGKQASAPKGSASFGSGIAVAPYQWAGSASVGHKLGPLKLTAGFGFSKYLEDAGNYRSLALKIAWKINDRFRFNAAVSNQWDTDSDGASTRSWSVSGGLRYTFAPPPEPEAPAEADAPAADAATDGKGEGKDDKGEGDGKPDPPKSP